MFQVRTEASYQVPAGKKLVIKSSSFIGGVRVNNNFPPMTINNYHVQVFPSGTILSVNGNDPHYNAFTGYLMDN